ncbi:hypothetical protein Tco_1058240 [Tanacetum coccineum]|uniref:Uncharacterized protein n=1 Tax=Tanacetum coccineum TaxID=301880 RepID=A0ABQ5H7Q7_9ASTR
MKEAEDKSKDKQLEEVPIVSRFPESPRAIIDWAPSEMKELSDQLKELSDKGFINPVSFTSWGLRSCCQDERKMEHSGCALILGRLLLGHARPMIKTPQRDVDHAGCKDDCKSTSEGLQFLDGKLVKHVEKGTVEIYFVGTEYQLADLFTKALPKELVEYLVHRIGMRCMTPTQLESLTKLSS